MKKTLLLILIVLLVSLSIYIALKGFSIGENIEILSYQGIQQRNKELDEVIQQASKLAQIDYISALNNVENSARKLMNTKKSYDDMVLTTTENGVQVAAQIEEYKVETLWVKIGSYATAEGVILQMDIRNSSTGGANRYNLYFTVNGRYISITDFISDIENDSTLGFKIEDFKISQYTSETDLVATFTCRDIAIQDVEATTNISTTEDETLDDNQTTNTDGADTTTDNTENTNNTTTDNSTNTTNTTE